MNNKPIISHAGDLSHHGIIGMKWGVRRYQNKDGSLTTAGKKRRAKLEAELKKLDGDKSESTKSSKPKTLQEMTDEELRAAVNRLQLERQYRETYAALHPQKVKKGKQYIDTLVSKSVEGLAEGSKRLITEALFEKGKEALGLKKESGSEKDKLQKEYDTLELKRKIKNLKSGSQAIADEAQRLENQKKIEANKIALDNMKKKKKKDEKSGD